MAFPIPNSPSPSSSPLSLSLYLPRSSTLFLHSHSKFSFRTLTFSSLRTTTTTNHSSSSSKPNTPSAPWLAKSPSPKRVPESTTDDPFHPPTDKGQNAVERIVLRLRNLGLASEEEVEEEEGGKEEEAEEVRVDAFQVTGEERLGELLRREWVRPDAMVLLDEDKEDEETVLPWEREEKEKENEKEKGGGGGDVGLRKRSVKAPTLAELTLEDELLRRLRREGMRVRERISVPKAGLTQDVMDKIHGRWRKEELVRLKFHEDLALDMKTAHEIVEVSFVALLCFAYI